MKYFVALLLISSPVFSFNFTRLFDHVERADLDKVVKIIERIKPGKEPLPYHRTLSHGMVVAMEWKFRQKISMAEAYIRAKAVIMDSNLSDADKAELLQITEYLCVESNQSLLEKGIQFFSKKKKVEEVPRYRKEAVEIYYGALFSQISWDYVSAFGGRMMADGIKKLEMAQAEVVND